MAKALKQWKVLPHGQLTQLDDRIMTVTGELHMPLGDFSRRMTIVRLHDGRLVIYSAIALDDAQMREVEVFGRPTYLIVPGALHRMDAKIWKDRYPDLCVIAPAGAVAKVNEVVPVDTSVVSFGDPSVRLTDIPGTAGHEAALLVHANDGTTIIVNDLISNLPHRRGLGGLMFRLLGFTGTAPRIFKVAARKIIRNKAVVRAQLEAWARLMDLRRIIVSHGAPIEREPTQVLHSLADSLAK